MKKHSFIILLSTIIISTSLTSCGSKNDQPTVVETVIIETTSEENLDVWTGMTGSEINQEWIAIGEQVNLAPSDTPKSIAEGGVYLPYTPTAMAQASGNIVLFFYASWSPASIATNKDITDKRDMLTKDITILRVNYDDADDMKQQYGITEQQTYVQVTNTGELIKKWRGANTVEDILKQVQT